MTDGDGAEDDTLDADSLLAAVARAPALTPPSPADPTGSDGDSDADTLAAAAGGYTELAMADPQHYGIGPEIARGGMGRIVAAYDRRLGRHVAIKQLLGGGGLSARFEREARITARLQHPSIVPIYDAGRLPSGEPFYAMKMVSGRSLDKVVAQARSLPERMALLPNVLAVVDALAYAHDERIIHRDLKPQNVLLGGFGETLVIDWGLAKDLRAGIEVPDQPHLRPSGTRPRQEADGETLAGEVMGTPAYMPPEQAAGRTVDERADVYALGAILYHVLAGEPAYVGRTMSELLEAVQARAPVPLGQRQPGVPADLQAIVAKAMAREPPVRYPTAKELAEDLKRFQTGQLVGSHRYTRRELAGRWLRRHRPALALIAATVVLAGSGLGGVTFVARRQAEAQRQRDAAARTAVQLLEEQGRQELLAGHADRAALYLAEAYARASGDPSPALRALTGAALRDVEGTAPGREIGALDGAGRIASAHLRGDGTYAVSLGDDGSARLWSGAGWKQTLRLGDPEAPVRGAAFSADGARLVTLDDRAVRTWEVTSGRALSSLPLAAPARAVLAGADQLLLVGAGPGGVRLLDVARPGGARLVASFDGPIAALSPDGSRVATGGEDGVVRVWDAATGKATQALHGHRGATLAIAFSPDGTRLATGSSDGTARLWAVGGGRLLASLEGPADGVHHVVFSADGERLATAGTATPIRVWDGRGGSLLATLTTRAPTAIAALHLAPQRTLVAVTLDGALLSWTWEEPIVAQLLGHRGAVHAVAFSPDRARVVTGGDDHLVRVWDPRTGKRLEELPGHTLAVRAVAFTSDGRWLVSAGDDRLVLVRDAETLRVVETLRDHEGPVRFAELDRRGERLVSGDDLALRLRALGGGAAVVRRADATNPWRAASFSRDGRTLAVARRSSLQLLGVGALEPRAEVPATELRAIAWSPDGAALLGAGADHRARLWDATSLRPLPLVLQHPAEIFAASWSSDGARLLTAGADGSARLWSARDGRLLASLAGHAGDVLAASFSQEGSLVATAGADGAVKVWDVALETRPPREVLDSAQRRAPWTLVDGTLVAR